MPLSLSRLSGEPTGGMKERALYQSDTVYHETCPVQTMHMSMVPFGKMASVQITNDYDQKSTLKNTTSNYRRPHTPRCDSLVFHTKINFYESQKEAKNVLKNSLHFTRVVL
jgi:hypothetical protein